MSKPQKLIIIILLPLLFVLGGTSGIVFVKAQTPAPAPRLTAPNLYDIYNMVNAERVKAGLQPLLLNPKLTASAQAKCADMVRLGEWEHDLSDGTIPQTYIQTALPDSYTKHWTGENISARYFDSTGVVNGWMGSLGHRANILNPHFTDVGYAMCQIKDYPNTVVQQFLD